MEEDISIINSNTRQEKVRNFFVNNKNKIISMIVVLVIILVGAYSFDSYKTNKKKEISNKFNSTTLAYSENIKDLTVQKLVDSEVPIFGICLGHQIIGQVFGSKIIQAKKVMHGKTSRIKSKKAGILKIHSLVQLLLLFHWILVSMSLSNAVS